MAAIVTFNLNLGKLDTTKVWTNDKGEKFYPLKVKLQDEVNQWGKNVIVTTDLKKEESDALKAQDQLPPILCSGKVNWTNGKVSAAPSQRQEETQPEVDIDLPF